MDTLDELRSTSAIPERPGMLAAHRRLSAASTPPGTEKPYLAGRVVASAVRNRLSKKAQLMQYLSGHGGTVNRMLGTVPEQPRISHLGAPPDGATGLSSTAPADCWTGTPHLRETYSPILSRQSNTSLFNCGMKQTSGLRDSTVTSASRSSSVSAYLLGQQDLLTTLAGADARTPSCGVAPAHVHLPRGQDNRLQDSVSMTCTDANRCSSAAQASSGSRHTAVKDALTARLSAAADARGSVSPRHHEASLSIREALMTEGRARRSLAAVMLSAPPPGSASATAAACASGGAEQGMISGNLHAAAPRNTSSQVYPPDLGDRFSGCAMGASWQQGKRCEVAGTGTRRCTESPFGMYCGQYANCDNTAMEAAGSATWMHTNMAADAEAAEPEQTHWIDYGRSESSDDSAGGDGMPGARRGSSSTDSSRGSDAAVLGSKVRGWRQRLSSVKVARSLGRSPGLGRQGASKHTWGITRPVPAVPASLTSIKCQEVAGGALQLARPQGSRYSAAGVRASAVFARQTASLKQRGVRRKAHNRWSSRHSTQDGRSGRRDSSSSSTTTSSSSSSSSNAWCRRQSNSSSDGPKCVLRARSSMYQQHFSNSQQQRQAGTPGGVRGNAQGRQGHHRTSQSSWLPAAGTRRGLASAVAPCRYTSLNSLGRYSRHSSDSSNSSHSSRNLGSRVGQERVFTAVVPRVSRVSSGTGPLRPSKCSIYSRVLVRSQPCPAEKRRRRQLAVSLLQKVGRQLHRRCQSRNNSSSEDGQSLRRSSVSGSLTVRRGFAGRRGVAGSVRVLRRSSSSSSSSSRDRSSSRWGVQSAAGHSTRWAKEVSVLGDTSAATAARRTLSGALECILNPADKPAHRMSLRASDAAAVVLGRGSRAHSPHGNSFKLGALNVRGLRRISSVNHSTLRRTSSNGSSGGDLGNGRAGSSIKQPGAGRRSTAGPPGAAARPSACLRACLRSERTAAPRRSRAAPSIMVRPGRKSWAQVYQEAVGVVPQ